MADADTSTDLLEGGEAPEPQTGEPGEHVAAGPPDHGGQLAEWVPGEFHDPARRADLIKAVGLDPDRLQEVPTERPEFLPEKFWEAGKGPRLEQLAKSYSELEKKLHDKGVVRPEPPESYALKPPEGLEIDGEGGVVSDNTLEVFKELGLDNEAAQKLVNHFYEDVVPVLAEQQGQVEAEKLAGSWGMKTGSAEYKQRLGAINQWAGENMPMEALQHLRSSANGVQAMWNMMNTRRPPGESSAPTRVTKEKIDEMVSHPDYWDPSKPEYRRKVQELSEQMGG